METQLNLHPVGAAYFFSMPLPISFNAYKNLQQRTSKRGRIWRDNAIACVWDQCGGRKPDPLVGRCAIYYELWLPDDKRKRDADNYTGKHVQDMLVNAGVFPDDHTGHISELHVYYRGKAGNGCLLISALEI